MSLECKQCGNPLVDLSRGPKCPPCYRLAQKRKRDEDPEKKIASRFRKWCNKHGITAKKNPLWKPETIQYVLKRWDRKCPMTGESDLSKLTIVSFCEPHLYLTQDDLVLVSSSSAVQLGKSKDRELAFPDDVRQRMVTKE